MVEREAEQAWVAQSRQGDHAAFENLVKQYQRMIHALAYRMTGSLEDAEDLAQEAFIQAHRNLAQLRDHEQFSSWLYRIATNLALNWHQRRRRLERVRQQFENQTLAGHQPGNSEDQRQAITEQVMAALAKLPPKQRAAVVLTTYEGLNHAEAARMLGCSETTVSWRVFAARAKLKRWLKPLHRHHSP